MSNPPFLACDTDALIQFFIVNELRPLRQLSAKYCCLPVILPEVEVEVRNHRKFKRRFEPQLNKALRKGTLRILDPPLFSKHAANLGSSQTLVDVEARGEIYAKRVGQGEAYTLAAGVELKIPALTNDRSALKTLSHHGYPLPSPTLRVFDLIGIFCQTGSLDLQSCEDFLGTLKSKGEWVPAEFQNASFAKGCTFFTPRLVDVDAPKFAKPNGSTTGHDRLLRLKAEPAL